MRSSVESLGSVALLIIAALFFFDLFTTQVGGLMRTTMNQVGNVTSIAPTVTVPPGSPSIPQALNASVSKATNQWFTIVTQYTPYLISAAMIALIVALGVIIGALNAKATRGE
ncbi:MAG: hypothetical protein ACP5NY_04045 [Thermocladium sp.]